MKHPGTREEQILLDQLEPTSANLITHGGDAGNCFTHDSALQLSQQTQMM